MTSRSLLNIAVSVSAIALAVGVPQSASAQDSPDPVQILRVASEIADGKQVLSTSQDLLTARGRRGDHSMMAFDPQDGAIVLERQGSVTYAPLRSRAGTQLVVGYDYDSGSLRGQSPSASVFNAYLRPLALSAPSIGNDMEWMIQTTLPALGLAAHDQDGVTIKLKRTSVRLNGAAGTLLEYDIPAFAYRSPAGETVIHWARGFAVADQSLSQVQILGTQHRATVLTASGEIRPLSVRNTVHAIDPSGRWTTRLSDSAEVRAALQHVREVEGSPVHPVAAPGDGSTADPFPAMLASYLDMAAFAAAEGGANPVPVVSGVGTSSAALLEALGLDASGQTLPSNSSSAGPPTEGLSGVSTSQILSALGLDATGQPPPPTSTGGKPTEALSGVTTSQILSALGLDTAGQPLPPTSTGGRPTEALSGVSTSQILSALGLDATGQPLPPTSTGGRPTEALSGISTSQILSALGLDQSGQANGSPTYSSGGQMGGIGYIPPETILAALGLDPVTGLAPASPEPMQALIESLLQSAASLNTASGGATTAEYGSPFVLPVATSPSGIGSAEDLANFISSLSPEERALYEALSESGRAYLENPIVPFAGLKPPTGSEGPADLQTLLEHVSQGADRLLAPRIQAGSMGGFVDLPAWIQPGTEDAEDYNRLIQELLRTVEELRLAAGDDVTLNFMLENAPGPAEGYDFFENNAFDYTVMVGVIPTDLSRWEEWLATQNVRELERLASLIGYPNLASALADANNLIRQSQDPGYRQWAMQPPSCGGYVGCGPSYLERWWAKQAVVALGDILADSRDIFSTGGFSDIGISGFNLAYLLRDHALEDGDIVRIRISQFGHVIYEGQVNLTNAGEVFDLIVGRGVASLEIYAVNEGSASPNTAQITVDNVVRGQATQTYSLSTGETATLRIEAGATPNSAGGGQ